MSYLLLTMLAVLLAFAQTTAHSATLVVAWVENGRLMMWHEGQTVHIEADDVSRLFVAPDGQHIAFTGRENGSLWVVGLNGSNPQQFISGDQLASNLVADVAWLDASTLYFNTAQVVEVGQLRQNDLWQTDITTHNTRQLLAADEGGNFSISPDKQSIVIVHPGVYGSQNGGVSLVTSSGANRRELLGFPAVSTGSEYLFYPPVDWQRDSSAFRLAIPDADLIYHDASAATVLWRINVDGSSKQIGSIQASFFGQPVWSSDGKWLLYVRRIGETNQLEMVVADENGQNPAVYATGEAGNLQPGQWLPGSDQFIYAQGQPGSYLLGAPGAAPQPLPGTIYAPVFVSSSLYVYTTPSSTGLELRYADLTDPRHSTLITQTTKSISFIDAVLSEG